MPLALPDHEFLAGLDFPHQLVGELDRRELIVLAGLDQHRTVDLADVGMQREFLRELRSKTNFGARFRATTTCSEAALRPV